MAAEAHHPVDVLVVATGSTPGNRRSDTDLITALRELGLAVAVASSDFGLVGSLPMSLNLIDLTQAISIRVAVDRALRRVSPRAIIYGSGSAALLEPRTRLRVAGVRFDALAVDNRPGHRHVVQRALQRRMIGSAALMLPWSPECSWPHVLGRSPRRPLTLPVPVEPFRPDDRHPRRASVVCYAGAPEKKQLDLMLGGWARADLSPMELLITGIDEDAGRRWLAGRGIDEPPRVRWCGHLDRTAYRTLTSEAMIYLAASRYEDYGIAQLEALADGALLVTTPSAGPYAALPLVRTLDPLLVAEDSTAGSLAGALRHAADLSASVRADYRARSSRLLESCSPAAFRSRLEHDVLPALFAAAETAA